MYSVVLMMALTTGGEAPAWGGHGCSGGCYGSGSGSCSGSGYGGCMGSSYGSCTGSCHGGSSHGCHGGGCHGFLGGHRRAHGCHGGSCHGCSGGSCYGGGCYGGGCHGGAYSGGCYGGAYSGGCTGGGCWGMSMEMVPAGKPVEKKEEKKDEKKKATPEEVSVPAPATIVVSLPAEAKLLIGDAPTSATSAVRTFASPTLEPGKDYYYTIKGELVRDGRTVTATKQVRVRAGQETQVQLDFSSVAVAAK